MKTRKSLLVLSSRIPYPLVGGDRIRIYNFGKHLSADYDIDLLALHNGRVEGQWLEALRKAFRKVVLFPVHRHQLISNAFRGLVSNKPLQESYYKFDDVGKWIESHMHEYDGVFANHIRMSHYVEDKPIPKWVDLHDAISFNYSGALGRTRGIWNLIYRFELPRVLASELNAIEKFDKSFIVSERDKEFLVQHGGNREKIVVAPVAVPDDLLNRNLEGSGENQICFVGKMDTVANVDAVCYFAHEVFPLVRKIRPEIRFLIVGANPTSKVKRLASLEGIEVTGWVQDPCALLARSKVIVAPMKIGAGMQNKVLEAMALGKAVVTSTLAANGIGGTPNEHYLVADSPDDEAQAVLGLLENKQRRQEIGRNARLRIMEYHTWSALAQALKTELDKTFSLYDNNGSS